jgi:phosphomethylpyrimidine synthase
MTQLEAARKGIVTEEMAYVAEREGVSPEFVREGVAAGRIVIPRNPNHETLKDFKGIGEGLSVKVNANLGTSYDYVDVEEEVEKARVAIRYGADTLMDLSTGGISRRSAGGSWRWPPFPWAPSPSTRRSSVRQGAGTFLTCPQTSSSGL